MPWIFGERTGENVPAGHLQRSWPDFMPRFIKSEESFREGFCGNRLQEGCLCTGQSAQVLEKRQYLPETDEARSSYWKVARNGRLWL